MEISSLVFSCNLPFSYWNICSNVIFQRPMLIFPYPSICLVDVNVSPKVKSKLKPVYDCWSPASAGFRAQRGGVESVGEEMDKGQKPIWEFSSPRFLNQRYLIYVAYWPPKSFGKHQSHEFLFHFSIKCPGWKKNQNTFVYSYLKQHLQTSFIKWGNYTFSQGLQSTGSSIFTACVWVGCSFSYIRQFGIFLF